MGSQDFIQAFGSLGLGQTEPFALGMEQKPKSVMKTAFFLCTDDADYLTGQTVLVDGGTFMH
jgi:NAD(P)-dependent dehydrogenase (short-subunit alcohol dehydrogenase family)